MSSRYTPLLLYGANGYTGELIAREARARDLQPILAGRNTLAIERLAKELGCEFRSFALEDEACVARGLEGVSLVLHCAGPFSSTARPMIAACLRARAHYLDITGEIEVFEWAHDLDAKARAAGILLCPGAGFDVVPSDCLAAQLKRAMPDATHLALGFDSRSTPSRGSTDTASCSPTWAVSTARPRRPGDRCLRQGARGSRPCGRPTVRRSSPRCTATAVQRSCSSVER